MNCVNQNNEINRFLWLILGALLGFMLNFLKDTILNIRKKLKYKKYYSKYEGFYLAYKKYDNKNEKVYRCFELIRDRNKFIIKNGISTLGHEDFNAEITMNENNWNHGYGYIQDSKSVDNITGFGFLEIQLANTEILVHEKIYNNKEVQNSNAYKWIKQFPENRDNFFNEYRQIQINEKKKKFAKHL